MPARKYPKGATCTEPECDRPLSKLGLCNMHYLRQHRHGSTANPRPRQMCTAEGCDRPAQGRGLCKSHYYRWYMGSEIQGPIAPYPAKLPQGELPSTMSRGQWLIYAAGFFDGEGCISIIRTRARGKLSRNYYLQLSTGQLDPAPLFILQSLFGGYIKSPPKKEQRTVYRWTLTHKRAGPTIAELLPYLIVKRKQAECGLEFASITNAGRNMTDEVLAERERLCQKLTSLKYCTYALPDT